MRYQEDAPRGLYYQGRGTASQPLYRYQEVRDKLPEPVLAGHDAWLGCYEYAWTLAFSNARRPAPESGFISNFVDAAFNQDFFLWDTVFITMFTDLARPFLPGIEALDNFYVKQLPDGEIPRELVRQTGADMEYWVNHRGLPLHSYFHNQYGFRRLFSQKAPAPEEMYYPDLGRPQDETAYYTLDNLNHPLLAWGELQSFSQTGNLSRLAEVLPPLLRQYGAMKTLLRHANGLYVSDWASMDNSPRNRYLGCALDTSCEMTLFAENLLDIIGILERADLCRRDEGLTGSLERDRAALTEAVNRLMWDEDRGFYFDLCRDGSRAPVRTAAAFWALAAGIADKTQGERLVQALEDPRSFKRLHRTPVCAADEEGYDPRGGYWRGSVWAPINTMILYGLERYGYHKLAAGIALNHLDAVARVWEQTGTIWENYPPDSISSADADKRDFVGWSGIGPTRYLLRYGIGLAPDAPALRLNWNPDPALLRQGPLGCRRFRFGGPEDGGGFETEIETDLCIRPEGGKLSVTAAANRPYTLVLNLAPRRFTLEVGASPATLDLGSL
ncbi:MAG: hypothetical protein LBQ46_02405 [Treponema sp.]|jgi:hypothetical protein|nr:hypothetical protein [Treponema sp.]